MSARTVGVVALGLCLAAACSSSPSTPGTATPLGGSGGGGTDGGATGGTAGSASGGTAGSGTGGAAGASGASGGTGGSGAGGTAGSGTGGSAGQDGGAGSGGSGGTFAKCGDGVLQFGEQCDGTQFGGATCQSLGFSTGTLSCKNCQIDSSGCSGQENCTDGIDNDGDGLIDCADPDCTAFCADSCANAVVLADPSDVTGDTTGHSTEGFPTCGQPGGSAAAAVAYQFTAANTGRLDIVFSTSAPLLVAVRTSCADPTTETYCGPLMQASIPVTQGDKLFLVVTGATAGDTGSYDLSVRSRVPKCGDGILDPGEQCDDGNTVSGDGCSSTCQIESSETEPNDTVAEANNYVDPFYAQINPSGDVDVVKVNVPSAGSTLTADTFDFGDGACYKQLLDSYIDIIGTDGSTVIASDDDSGTGLCAHAVASNLAAGTYYVRVKASPFGNTPTFPYVLHVSVQ